MRQLFIPVAVYALLHAGLLYAMHWLEQERAPNGRQDRMLLSILIALTGMLVFATGMAADAPMGAFSEMLLRALALSILLFPGCLLLGRIFAPQFGYPGWQGWFRAALVTAVMIGLEGAIMGSVFAPGLGTVFGLPVGFILMAKGWLPGLVLATGLIAARRLSLKRPLIRAKRPDSSDSAM